MAVNAAVVKVPAQKFPIQRLKLSCILLSILCYERIFFQIQIIARIVYLCLFISNKNIGKVKPENCRVEVKAMN